MANTSQKHKQKKSQKRKERQLRRKQKQELIAASRPHDEFIVEAMKQMKGTSKSLPGFLAKNVDLICRWLYDYFLLFQKADDACIEYMKFMDRNRRNQLVQDYVDMHIFIDTVKQLKQKANAQMQDDVKCNDNKQLGENNEEMVQEDMG